MFFSHSTTTELTDSGVALTDFSEESSVILGWFASSGLEGIQGRRTIFSRISDLLLQMDGLFTGKKVALNRLFLPPLLSGFSVKISSSQRSQYSLVGFHPTTQDLQLCF